MDKKKKSWYQILTEKGVPAILIPGIIFAITLGWTGYKKLEDVNYYQNTVVFPTLATVTQVIDGDTIVIETEDLEGAAVRLIGVDAPTRDEKSTKALTNLVKDKKVWLEYDRYQDDKYGRLLAWVWINCESEPEFMPFDYMRLNASASKPGLMTNPKGCEQGKLVQEELLRQKVVVFKAYKDRGELKYQNRLYY